jgi:Predicted hydrolases of the HAD superfamily
VGHAGGAPLAPPVSGELEEALSRRGVALRRGQAILAGHARDAAAALEEIGRLGLEVQVVRNRQELMLVPAGVSKGTGLFDALGDLGISRHSTVAIGDAENDHSLLGACELGVAVADAVPSLRAAADVVLPEAGSAALARFLLGPAVLSDETPEPRRFQAALGTYEDGSPARVPASGVNVLVTGGSMSGKSHLTGLLAERLLALGYSLCVLDPEGDHVALGRLRGVLAVGGTSRSRGRTSCRASSSTGSGASSSTSPSSTRARRRPTAAPPSRSSRRSGTTPGSRTGSSWTRRRSC